MSWEHPDEHHLWSSDEYLPSDTEQTERQGKAESPWVTALKSRGPFHYTKKQSKLPSKMAVAKTTKDDQAKVSSDEQGSLLENNPSIDEMKEEICHELKEFLRNEIATINIKEKIRDQVRYAVTDDMGVRLPDIVIDHLSGNVLETVKTVLKEDMVEYMEELKFELHPGTLEDYGGRYKETLEGRLQDMLLFTLTPAVREELQKHLDGELICDMVERSVIEIEASPDAVQQLKCGLKDHVQKQMKLVIENDLPEDFMKDLRDQLSQKLRAELKEELKAHMNEDFQKRLQERLYNELRKGCGRALQANLRERFLNKFHQEQGEKLKNDLKIELSSIIREELKAEMKNEMNAKHNERLQKELMDELKDELRKDLMSEFLEEMKTDLKNELKEQLEEDLRKELKKELIEKVEEDLRKEFKKELKDIVQNHANENKTVKPKDNEEDSEKESDEAEGAKHRYIGLQKDGRKTKSNRVFNAMNTVNAKDEIVADLKAILKKAKVLNVQPTKRMKYCESKTL